MDNAIVVALIEFAKEHAGAPCAEWMDSILGDKGYCFRRPMG